MQLKTLDKMIRNQKNEMYGILESRGDDRYQEVYIRLQTVKELWQETGHSLTALNVIHQVQRLLQADEQRLRSYAVKQRNIIEELQIKFRKLADEFNEYEFNEYEFNE